MMELEYDCYFEISYGYSLGTLSTREHVNNTSLFPINALDHWRGWSVSTIDKAKRKISAT